MPQYALQSYFDSDGDNSAQTMKAGPGWLYMLEVSNPNTADAFIQLFDALAADVTVGTTTPKHSFLVTAAAASDRRGGIDRSWLPIGLGFETGITYACTTTPTGNGDPTTGLTVNANYH